MKTAAQEDNIIDIIVIIIIIIGNKQDKFWPIDSRLYLCVTVYMWKNMNIDG